jgi:hypothetical protein
VDVMILFCHPWRILRRPAAALCPLHYSAESEAFENPG